MRKASALFKNREMPENEVEKGSGWITSRILTRLDLLTSNFQQPIWLDLLSQLDMAIFSDSTFLLTLFLHVDHNLNISLKSPSFSFSKYGPPFDDLTLFKKTSRVKRLKTPIKRWQVEWTLNSAIALSCPHKISNKVI